MGQDDLARALAVSDDGRASALLGVMLDPAYRHYSFGKLCHRVGLRYTDVFDIFRRSQVDRAMIRVARHYPDLMEQTAEDALSRDETCLKCDGAGKLDSKTCQECRGKGTVRVLGDVACLKLIWQTAGLVGKGRRQ